MSKNNTIRVRGATFETNSSSTHSLHLSEDTKIYPQPYFTPEQIESKKYVLVVEDAEFGWEIEDHYDMETKMKYVVAHEATTYERPLEQSPNLEKMKSIFKEHTGIELVIAPTDDKWYPLGYVDHQSVGEISELFEDAAKLKQFIFDDNSYIHTDNDNHY